MNRLTFHYHVTASSIIAYAQSIEAPLQKAGEVLIAPPTMPIIFWQIADVPWLDKAKTFIHGRQSFTYRAPLMADSHLVCDLMLTNTERKTGSRGDLILYTHRFACTCKGELIVTAETVLIEIEVPS